MKKPEKSHAGPMLVNKLSVKDARHLLRHEGGEASRAEYAVQWITSFSRPIFCAAGFPAGAECLVQT
jgi:hypothetical protein